MASKQAVAPPGCLEMTRSTWRWQSAAPVLHQIVGKLQLKPSSRVPLMAMTACAAFDQPDLLLGNRPKLPGGKWVITPTNSFSLIIGTQTMSDIAT
jgi:hypothetical protein